MYFGDALVHSVTFFVFFFHTALYGDVGPYSSTGRVRFWRWYRCRWITTHFRVAAAA